MAITVRQPWASLLVTGAKRVETRPWDTKVRGSIAIHAGLAMPCRIGQRITLGPYEVERDRGGLLLRSERLSWPYRLPLGAVVGVVDLFQTRSTTSSGHKPDDVERALGDHSPGRFAWSTSSAQRLARPVPALGRQGFWTLPDDVEAAVLAQIGGAL